MNEGTLHLTIAPVPLPVKLDDTVGELPNTKPPFHEATLSVPIK